MINGTHSETPALMVAKGLMSTIDSFLKMAAEMSQAPIFAEGELGKLSLTDCILTLPKHAQDSMMVKQLRVNANGDITGVVVIPEE